MTGLPGWHRTIGHVRFLLRPFFTLIHSFSAAWAYLLTALLNKLLIYKYRWFRAAVLSFQSANQLGLKRWQPRLWEVWSQLWSIRHSGRKIFYRCRITFSVPAVVCYDSHGSTSLVCKVWGYRMYDESFDPHQPQGFNPHPHPSPRFFRLVRGRTDHPMEG